MNNKFWLVFFIAFTITACGGGGGSSSYSGSSGGSSNNTTPTLSNLNPLNACKKAWYTTMPTATSTNVVFNNYSFFWQETSFEAMPICENYYEATSAITSTGGITWKTYVNELLEYSKNRESFERCILNLNAQSKAAATAKINLKEVCLFDIIPEKRILDWFKLRDEALRNILKTEKKTDKENA